MQIYNNKIVKQRYVIKNTINAMRLYKSSRNLTQGIPWAYTVDGHTLKSEIF